MTDKRAIGAICVFSTSGQYLSNFIIFVSRNLSSTCYCQLRRLNRNKPRVSICAAAMPLLWALETVVFVNLQNKDLLFVLRIHNLQWRSTSLRTRDSALIEIIIEREPRPQAPPSFSMLYIENREGLVCEVTFRWKGDYRAWVLALYHQPTLAHFLTAMWLEIEALETMNESTQ